MKKQALSALTALTIILSLPCSAYAHSGRTDSNGGHKDNKNKSGLGSYHYHCGGNPAHLHSNGKCPYDSTEYKFENENSSSSKKKNTDSSKKSEWIGDMYWTGSEFAKGWYSIGKKTYYFDEYGFKTTDRAYDNDDNAYYFGNDGIMRTGWQKIDGSRYFFSSQGIMRTGWRKIEGETYYFGTDGKMRTGLRKISGSVYYFDTDGKMQTGWTQIGDDMYYFKSNGKMITGKVRINGESYEFDENGRLAEQE